MREDKIEKCRWVLDSFNGYHYTDCSHAFIFNEEGAEENGFKFCPFCGKELEESVNDD